MLVKDCRVGMLPVLAHVGATRRIGRAETPLRPASITIVGSQTIARPDHDHDDMVGSPHGDPLLARLR